VAGVESFVLGLLVVLEYSGSSDEWLAGHAGLLAGLFSPVVVSPFASIRLQTQNEITGLRFLVNCKHSLV
jgi:hypothetical protein